MKNNFAAIAILTLLGTMVSSCGSLPLQAENRQETTFTEVSRTKLFQIFSSDVQEHADDSGFILLRKGVRALNERILLADIAEQTIDAQYYIWNSDKSGKLFLNRLIQSADRGVSVRLLLDDFNVSDRDDQLLAVNSHPNIQIRIYNPFVTRSGVIKWLNFAVDFNRLNRRMHNKTYIVDGTAAIVGGRNIGDEYFNQNSHLNFSDLDLLTIGPVVEQVSESFEAYWNSPWAIPVDQILTTSLDQIEGKELLNELHDTQEQQLHLSPHYEAIDPETNFQQIIKEFVWAHAEFFYDEPGADEKTAHPKGPKRVAQKLIDLAEKSRHEVLIESAYFVLNEPALKLAGRLQESGVRIYVLTNSMASNDVLPNHASYAMVRRDMLDQGIELFELRPDAVSCLELIGHQNYCDDDSFLGLHSKAAVFDRKIVYIGSLNFNLRSAYLNSEVGMIIHSPVLAEQLVQQIEQNMLPENSWQAVLDEESVQWVTEIDGEEVRSNHEPQTSWRQRFKAGVLTLLPGANYF